MNNNINTFDPELKDDKTASLKSLIWEPININDRKKRERIEVLDIFRGLGLFGMMLFNVVQYLGSSEVQYESAIGYIHTYIFPFCTVGAFHLLLGIYLIYAPPTTKKLLLRGAQLLLLGYLLNIVRYLPIIIGVNLGTVSYDNFFSLNNISDVILRGDIFHYAGLALLAFALLRKVIGETVRPVYLLLLAFIVLYAPLFLPDIKTGIIYLDRILSLLWGGYHHVHYPFFPWFSYSLAGAAFGCLLIKLKGFGKIEKVFTISAVLTILAGIYLVYFLDEPSGMFFLNLLNSDVPIRIETFIFVIGYYMCWQALYIYLYKRVPGNFILKAFSFWSKNIMTFYMWHAIILGWIAGIYSRGFEQLNTIETAIAIVVVILGSHYLTMLTSGVVETKIRASVQK